MRNEKTLIETLIDEGYPAKDILHHASDLYIYKTEKTEKILKQWYQENGFNMEHHTEIFVDNMTNKLMYDCYFMYYDLEEITEEI